MFVNGSKATEWRSVTAKAMAPSELTERQWNGNEPMILADQWHGRSKWRNDGQWRFLVDNPATILYSITWDANHSRWRDPSEYGSSPKNPRKVAVNSLEADFLVQRKIVYYFDLVLDIGIYLVYYKGEVRNEKDSCFYR